MTLAYAELFDGFVFSIWVVGGVHADTLKSSVHQRVKTPLSQLPVPLLPKKPHNRAHTRCSAT